MKCRKLSERYAEYGQVGYLVRGGHDHGGSDGFWIEWAWHIIVRWPPSWWLRLGEILRRGR